MAAAFALTTPVAAVVPHNTGMWLPLHLFTVGALLTAISGATQLLAVTWSSAPAPPAAAVRAQQALLGFGAVGLALGRELDAPAWVVATAGGAIIAALVLLAALLITIRRSAHLDRFHPAVDAYLLALALGIAGSGAGISLAVGTVGDRYAALRSAHLVTNLLGLVGLVIAATLPYFVATHVRSKMSPRATPAALRAHTGWLAVAVVAATAGYLLELRALAALGLGAYCLGVVLVVALVPWPGRHQRRWTGPRLRLLAAGVAWWAGTSGALAAAAAVGQPPPTPLVLTLVVGGYAQILLASLAYLGPVLRDGGHQHLADGFAATRSWFALPAINLAALALLAGWHPAAVLLLAASAIDVARRAARLARRAHEQEDHTDT